MTLAEEVANRETRLNHLEMKSEADENLIALLKNQNKEQADRLVIQQHQHDLEMQKVTQERDVAVQKAMEVSGIIESICRLGVEGLARMRGAPEVKRSPIEPYQSPPPSEESQEPARGQLPRPQSRSVTITEAKGHPSVQAVEDTLRKYPSLNKEEETEALPLFLADRPREIAGDRRLGGYRPR